MQQVSAYLFTSNSQTFIEFGNLSTYQTYHVSLQSLQLFAQCGVLILLVDGFRCPSDINQVLVWALLCHPQRLRQPATNSKLQHPQVHINSKMESEQKNPQAKSIIDVLVFLFLYAQ